MTLEQLKKYAKTTVEKYPHLAKEVIEIVQMAIEEVESGSSETHEVELAMDDIYELIS